MDCCCVFVCTELSWSTDEEINRLDKIVEKRRKKGERAIDKDCFHGREIFKITLKILTLLFKFPCHSSVLL